MMEVMGGDGRIKDRTGIAPQGAVCAARISGGSITSAATKLQFGIKEFDPFAWFDTTNYRFQPKVAGFYLITGMFRASESEAGTTVQYLFLYKNGANYKTLAQINSPSDASNTSVEGSALVYLNGGSDYVELWAQQTWTSGGIAMATTTTLSRFEAILVGVSTGVVPEPWHVVGASGEVAFNTNWTQYESTSGGTYQPLSFMKDPYGTVRLRGMAKTTSSYGYGAATATIFQLPAGYRPAKRLRIPAPHKDSANNYIMVILEIYTNGDVQIAEGVGGAGNNGTTLHISLDGISFRGEQ